MPEPAAPEGAQESGDGDDISVGKDLMVEGAGVGTVTAIDETHGQVTVFVPALKKMVTVGVDKWSLVPEAAPAPVAMRVVKK